MRERVKIVGDHPWRGSTGTATVEKDMGLAGWMVEVEMDHTEGIGGVSTCLAARENLRPLPKDEDPFA